MPFPYKRILCPVDFDQYSAGALKEAASLALNGVGILHVLHAVQVNPLVEQGAAEGCGSGELFEAQIEVARKQVEQMLAAIPAQLKVEVLVEIGEPVNSILNAQTKLGADLIVMATHGRTGLKHFMLGSVAERVVRQSRAPVLTIRSAPSSQSE